jgi:hypothetical protein
MSSGCPIFAQIIKHARKRRFQRWGKKCKGDCKTYKFSGWDQFLCLSSAQLIYHNNYGGKWSWKTGFGLILPFDITRSTGIYQVYVMRKSLKLTSSDPILY